MPLFSPPVKNPWLSIPDGSLDAWNIAKSLSASAQARIFIVGDSDGSGYGTSNWYTKRWSSLLRSQLVAKYGGGTEFFVSTLQADYAALPGTPPFTRQGATALSAVGGGYGRGVFYAASSVNTTFQTFISPIACTDIDIHYVDLASNGSFGYTIDGGSNQTLTIPTTITLRQNKIKLTGLSNATHTIAFNNSSQSGALILAGITCYPTSAARTTGIAIANTATTGEAGSDWLGITGYPGDMPSQLAGTYGGWTITGITNVTNPVVSILQTPTVPLQAGQWLNISGVVGSAGFAVNSATNNGFWQIASVQSPTSFTINMAAPGAYTSGGNVYAETGFGWPSAPNLVIIMTGGNDMQNTNGPDAYFDGLKHICQAARRGSQNCSIMLIAEPLPDPVSSDVRFVPGSVRAWQMYITVMRELGLVFNAAFYNLYSDIGQLGFARGFQSQGNYHMTDTGHQHLCDAISAVLI